jgi:hypothetical protein
MTEEQKRKMNETRKKNAEARKAKSAARTLMFEKMQKACVDVLDDPNASAKTKLNAVTLLQNMEKIGGNRR